MKAVGFPGQGGNWNATLATVFEHRQHPLVRALLSRIGGEHRVVPEAQGDVRISQPAVLVAGLVACDKAGLRPGVDGAAAAVGHSLGELTACVFAGALDQLDGLELAARRGELTHEAFAARPGAMLLVAGIDEAALTAVCRRVLDRASGQLAIAVQNSSTQFVVSGDAATIEVCRTTALDAGATARQLPIGGAFHSPLLEAVANALHEEVKALPWRRPLIPIVFSTAASLRVDDHSAPEALALSLVRRVNWDAALDVLVARGCSTLIDAGPGDTLVRLGRSNPVLSVERLTG